MIYHLCYLWWAICWPQNLELVFKNSPDLELLLWYLSHCLVKKRLSEWLDFTVSNDFSHIWTGLYDLILPFVLYDFFFFSKIFFSFSSREREIQIWDHFIRALKNGILALNSEDDDYNTPPILPCIVTNFLAHMSLIISEPLHSLYVPLTNFLLAKPSFDVNTIPNFLALFYSTDLKNR